MEQRETARNWRKHKARSEQGTPATPRGAATTFEATCLKRYNIDIRDAKRRDAGCVRANHQTNHFKGKRDKTKGRKEGHNPKKRTGRAWGKPREC